MKKYIITRQLLDQFDIFKHKPLRESLLYSLKYGLITFWVLLFFLGFFEYLRGIILENPIEVVDRIDFAIAFMGFFLMFAAKLLEKLYGRN